MCGPTKIVIFTTIFSFRAYRGYFFEALETEPMCLKELIYPIGLGPARSRVHARLSRRKLIECDL